MKTVKFFFRGMVFSMICTMPAFGGFWDCFWGGSNEETAYTRSYVPGMGGVTLEQVSKPNMNLGAPQPAIPVQATPQTQAISVPQATIPTIMSQTGPVGTVGQPVTQPVLQGGAANLPQAPPGTEIMYVLPSQGDVSEECHDGVKRTPAVAAKVVPPGTPGAVPVAVKTITVIRPKVEHEWSFSPIRNKTETLVKVVDPRTGRVVRTFCRTDENKSSIPWPHRKETVKYETVTAKVGVPVRLPATAAANHQTTTEAMPDGRHGVNYPLWNPDVPPIESGIHTTVVSP